MRKNDDFNDKSFEDGCGEDESDMDAGEKEYYRKMISVEDEDDE